MLHLTAFHCFKKMFEKLLNLILPSSKDKTNPYDLAVFVFDSLFQCLKKKKSFKIGSLNSLPTSLFFSQSQKLT